MSTSEYSLGQRAAAEAIGTFFLVFVGAGSVAMTLIIGKGAPLPNKINIGIGALGGAGDWLTIALAFGFAIMAMIYALGHVSGQHINPAVTLALLVRRAISLTDAVAYWIAQFVGGILGALAIGGVFGRQGWMVGALGAPAPFPGISWWQAGFAEAIGTFALVFVVFGLALNTKAPSGWAGLIIALNIAGLIILLGNVSGVAINPARTLGPIFGDWILGAKTNWWVIPAYFIAQAIGALAAAAVYPLVAERTSRARRARPAAAAPAETSAPVS